MKINCSVKHYLSNWTFYTGHLLDETVVFNGIVANAFQLKIPKHVMDYGMYYVCNTVYMVEEPRFKEIMCGYLEVYPSNINVEAVGGLDVKTGSARNVRSVTINL